MDSDVTLRAAYVLITCVDAVVLVLRLAVRGHRLLVRLL